MEEILQSVEMKISLMNCTSYEINPQFMSTLQGLYNYDGCVAMYNTICRTLTKK